jgi:hypothetical protein
MKHGPFKQSFPLSISMAAPRGTSVNDGQQVRPERLSGTVEIAGACSDYFSFLKLLSEVVRSCGPQYWSCRSKATHDDIGVVQAQVDLEFNDLGNYSYPFFTT